MTTQRIYKILLVSSSGGVLLDLLALEPWWNCHQTVWVAVRATDTESILGGNQKVYWLEEVSLRNPLVLPRSIFRAYRILAKEKPDLVISAGTGVAVGFFMAAKLMRISRFWIETFNLVETNGVAARICSRLANEVLIQKESLLAIHPRAVVIGELL